MDRQDNNDEIHYVHDVNWASDSIDEPNTKVDENDTMYALVKLASTDVKKFQSNNVNHEASSLMFPVLLPLLYERHEEDVNDVVATLLWIGRGYCNDSNGLPNIPNGDLYAEKLEETKMSMFKTIFPSLY
ncbi:hypothetical protein GUJ93_ZPchr0010g7908 [Zizania palustris]|uniref:Uncharacterized protein n=1 Tax=Zizania palustris TaxID=103762 RepID=A0A8J5W8D3_ZIZPA|nr:hypothetical protein GUJ93_ZPchr0010g7908 [Zizania palustris]